MDLTEKSSIQTPHSALLLACLTMLYTDENIAEDKVAMLNKLDKSGNGLLDSSEYKNIKKFFDTHHLNDCIEAVTKVLNSEEKKTVFLNLLDFALSDSAINEIEKELLFIYSSAFELEDEFFNQALHLMTLKNKPI